MKKKIVIWVCLAVVLGFSVYQIFFLSDLLNQLFIMYNEMSLSIKESGSYIIYRNCLIGFILNSIVCIIVSVLIYFFKDLKSEEIKLQLKNVKQKWELKKKEKKEQQIKKLENKLKEIKED